MLLVNPYFLFGLFALAIPVVIHLFNFRKFKRVYFPNVKFIKDIQLQTQKQSRLKHLIVLILRLLAITSIVLAFTQPYIPMGSQMADPGSGTAVSIYTDNSFSMEAQSKQGQLLDEARQKAREVIAAYRGSDRFQVLTNDFEGAQQRLNGKELSLEQLDQIGLSPVSRKLSEVVKRQQDLLSHSSYENKAIYLISDFQKSCSDLEAFPHDTNLSIFLIPLKANPTPNLSVDSCWFDSPVHQAGRNVQLGVRIKNHADQDFEKVPLKLLINGQQKAVNSFSIAAHSETTLELKYNDMEAGILYGLLEITDHPVIYDDRYYFAYSVTERIPVLDIYASSANIFIRALYGKDSSFSYTAVSERSIDYGSISHYNLIILDALPEISSGLSESLKTFVENGGDILIVPPKQFSGNRYASLDRALSITPYGPLKKTKQRLAHINLNHPVFADVFDYIPENIDLPSVFSYYEMGLGARSGAESLLSLQNGSPFMTVENFGQGKVYRLATPVDPETTDFPRHAIFVPSLYNIALQSLSYQRLAYELGKNNKLDFTIEGPKGDKPLKIHGLDNDFEIIPRQLNGGEQGGIYLGSEIRDAGHYYLTNGQDTLIGIAMNYNRAESDLSSYTAEELKKIIEKDGFKNIRVFENGPKNLSTIITELNLGIRLWKLFIILALVFLAAEVLLLRLWK